MGGVEAAFFDLDKTVISKSSSLALSRPMYRAGLVSRSALLRGAFAQIVYLLVGPDDADRPVHLPGGRGPDGAAPGAGAARVHRFVLARGGGATARRAPGRRR